MPATDEDPNGRSMSSGGEQLAGVVGVAGDPSPAWHALEAGAVEVLLHSSSHGLSAAEVEARLAHHGPNQLEEEPPPPLLVVLARQFRSPLIYILVAATAVTVVLGEYIDAG